jgi:hypothetical protein
MDGGCCWSNCGFVNWFSDVDKNLSSTFIVVPIALMAVMLNKRVMLMMFVEPTLVVMVIRQSAACTDGDEENSQD